MSLEDPHVPEIDDDPDADARALASTVRIRILRLCLDEPLTNREIAERLGRNPASVLHHVRTLVDRGFLAAEPARRGARGAREVPYRATRRSWRTPGMAGQTRVLIDAFLQEVALLPDPDAMMMVRLGLRLDEDAHAELRSRLNDLFQEYAAREPDPAGQPYSVFLALHEDVSRAPGRGALDDAVPADVATDEAVPDDAVPDDEAPDDEAPAAARAG